MSPPLLVLLVLGLPVLALAAATAAGTALVRRRYPPTGRFVDAGGVRFHVVDPRPGDDPGRPPVLVIHGASGNGEEIRAGLDGALAGRRAIYPDRPGHGWSSRGAAMSSPSAQAAALADLLDALGIARALVVGHSWGAAVAAAMAVERPERVAGLVLLAPATHPWPGGVAWYHDLLALPVVGTVFAWTVPLPAGVLVLRPAVRAVFRPEPVPPGYVERGRIPLVLRPAAFRANSADIRDLKANLLALSPRYPGIAVPTGIVSGDADAVVAPWLHAEALAREIDGAFLVTLPGAGHMPHQWHPEVVADVLARVERRAATAPAETAERRPANPS